MADTKLLAAKAAVNSQYLILQTHELEGFQLNSKINGEKRFEQHKLKNYLSSRLVQLVLAASFKKNESRDSH